MNVKLHFNVLVYNISYITQIIIPVIIVCIG